MGDSLSHDNLFSPPSLHNQRNFDSNLVNFSPTSRLINLNDCLNVRVRRNILTLNESQLADYINSVKRLYLDGTIDRLAFFHRIHYHSSHNQPLIFWWHRYFIWKFENELQRIKPGLTIPYWDASEEYKEPHKSIVLSDKYFGGNGEEQFHCVVNGFLKSLVTRLPDGKANCIKRAYYGSVAGTLDPWNDTQKIVDIIKSSKDSEKFRVAMEDSIHLDVHQGLGGLDANGYMNSPISPLDPIFYLHHANLDRWLYTWQLSSFQRFEMINGNQRLLNGTLIKLTKDYELDGYQNVTLDQILRIQEKPLCYTYDYLPLDKLSSTK
ncbi:hemocyanin G-type, units Oda to Odg-like [Panonychus citri]|uniref:hemocyanin G-type, units Oda to Odg-like n=1 Tax=Panonychus citri TaxID=50023 RepID=UPI0023079445|nr:hemocyanin G-type, units Oda to Odg-like [Panonychus citri]